MNAIYGGIAVAIIGAIGTLLGFWVKRTDNATQLTANNMKRMREDMAFLGALQDDNSDLRSWAQDVRLEWRSMQFQLKDRGTITEIHELPALPESRVQKLQEKRAQERADEY